jgi:hypothetical protein
MTDAAFEYAMTNESQQLESTKDSLFGAYNGVTGYFQNVRNYKNEEAEVKSWLIGGEKILLTILTFAKITFSQGAAKNYRKILPS